MGDCKAPKVDDDKTALFKKSSDIKNDLTYLTDSARAPKYPVNMYKLQMLLSLGLLVNLGLSYPIVEVHYSTFTLLPNVVARKLPQLITSLQWKHRTDTSTFGTIHQ